MHRSNGPKENISFTEKTISAILTSIVELIITTPFAVMATRFQDYPGKIFTKDLKASFSTAKNVIRSGGSLYSGTLANGVDKVFKRGYKFVGQGALRDNFLNPYCGSYIEYYFGKKYKNPIIEAIAGVGIGLGEVAFLPVDYWKTNKQKSSNAFQDRNLLKVIFSKEGYAGWQPTACRNIFGSGALFGVRGLLEAWQFNIILTNLIASTISILGTLPLDVLKTRIQIAASKTNSRVSVFNMAEKMWKEGGPMLFFRGGATKTTSGVLKLAFALTLYDWLVKQVHDWMNTNSFNEIENDVSPGYKRK